MLQSRFLASNRRAFAASAKRYRRSVGQSRQAQIARAGRDAMRAQFANVLAALAIVLIVVSFAAAWATPTDASGRGDFSAATMLLVAGFVVAALVVPILPRRR